MKNSAVLQKENSKTEEKSKGVVTLSPLPADQPILSQVKRKQIPVAGIVATPAIINFSHKEKYPQEREIIVFGIRGSVFSNVIISNASTFSVNGMDNISVRVTDDGKVFATINNGVVGQKGEIVAKYHDTTIGTITDIIKVNVVK